jgi:uncharacterized heparinase superfamily protein
MIRFLILMTVFLTSSCHNKTESIQQISNETSNTSINDQLDTYFYDYEIKPSIIVNNTESKQTLINLGKHKIKWLDTAEETKIEIDDDLFTLKDKLT